ncbi:hypothetical protein C8R44DRAFT_748104 [Mycena epipterygia]|nr:hypothetical protein C8R44DRAFT_748104 [Mycena epipterygia]
MEPAESPWSRMPAELADEIAGHNAHDVPSLRRMALVSKTVRSSAITHLFSVIHFTCVEDFSRWLDMLRRTPRLGVIVKKVKFSDPNELWARRHSGLQSVTKLTHAPVPPTIPVMPNVRVVEWARAPGTKRFDLAEFDPTIGIAYMALFPSIEKLHLRNIAFRGLVPAANFLSVCKSLKVLSLTSVEFYDSEPDSDSDGGLPLAMTHWSRLSPSPFNLTDLEELAVASIRYPKSKKDYLVELLEISPPAALKSLSFDPGIHEYLNENSPCSALTTFEKLIRLGAHSVINLAIEPTFGGQSENRKILDILDHLPALPALNSLTIRLGTNRQAEWLINALTSAPNLTTLTFRIVFHQDAYDRIREALIEILDSVFPSDASRSILKSVLTRKFPLIRKVRFHFCAPRASDMHSRPGLRKKIERRLKEKLEETGADLEEYLELAWFDQDYNPVTYTQVTYPLVMYDGPRKVFIWDGTDTKGFVEGSDDESDEAASDCES